MLTTFLLATSMAVGQAEEVGPHYEHLKDLEYFVGSWKIDGQMETEFEAFAELASDRLVQIMSYQWLEGKNFLTLSINDKARSPVEYHAVIGWDPVDKQIKSWDFNAQGARLNYVHVKTDNGWIIEGTSVFPGGSEGSYRGEMTIVDENTFRHKGKGILKQDGQEFEVTLSYEAKRRQRRRE